VNVAPVFGTAVNVIAVPDANEVPVGDCVTVPGPLTVVVSVYCGAVKVADTVLFEVTSARCTQSNSSPRWRRRSSKTSHPHSGPP